MIQRYPDYRKPCGAGCRFRHKADGYTSGQAQKAHTFLNLGNVIIRLLNSNVFTSANNYVDLQKAAGYSYVLNASTGQAQEIENFLLTCPHQKKWYGGAQRPQFVRGVLHCEREEDAFVIVPEGEYF